MHNISLAAALTKNKLHDTGAWLILLEAEIVVGDPLYLVYNNEPIIWPTPGGHEYLPFDFEIDPASEDAKGEFPELQLRVDNTMRALQHYLQQVDGCRGSIVTLKIVHSEHLNLTVPEVEETWAVTKVVTDERFVTFTLGSDYPMSARRPIGRFLKNFCPFIYKEVECGSTSSLPTCGHTLVDCRERNNSVRFGGEPAIPSGGLYATI